MYPETIRETPEEVRPAVLTGPDALSTLECWRRLLQPLPTEPWWRRLLRACWPHDRNPD